MFSCALTHPFIMECYCTLPETEGKKEREKEREDIQLISCEFLVRQTERMVLLKDSFHSR